MKSIKFFKNINKEDVLKAGGKGASLKEMYDFKIPVPNGFVILSSVYDSFLKENKFDKDIKNILSSIDFKKIKTIEKASSKIQSKILKGSFSKELLTDIISSFKKLKTDFVAVRSSATVEDSKDYSWAGQLNTYLFVKEKNLLESIKSCFASLFTSRAIFYRFKNKLNNKKISVAVVVQEMIDSEVSGIAFSIHPVTKDKNQIIIEAGYGQGEAIVSGQITPDSYVVSKNSFEILEKSISFQEKALYRCLKKNLKWKRLLKKDSLKQKLSDENIKRLSKLIKEIECYYSYPVDVEWAFFKNKIYILQSRPVTTL